MRQSGEFTVITRIAGALQGRQLFVQTIGEFAHGGAKSGDVGKAGTDGPDGGRFDNR